jgi:uncharacterized protein YcbK (DUF882 family)
MIWTRRRLLHAGAMAGITVAAMSGRPVGAVESAFRNVDPRNASPRSAKKPSTMAEVDPEAPGAASVAARRISLLNLHTSEKLDLEFSRGGAYVPESLAAIEVLLRDYRNGERHAIDSALMDYLYDVAQHIGVDPVFSVISGYRSPQTNEQLRERSNGVARHSLHLEGRAIDVRLAGVDCAKLADRARDMSRGGVGYYRTSNFVHLDTGAFRIWNG